MGGKRDIDIDRLLDFIPDQGFPVFFSDSGLGFVPDIIVGEHTGFQGGFMKPFAGFEFFDIFINGQGAADGLEKQIMEDGIRVDIGKGRVCPEQVFDARCSIKGVAVFPIYNRL